MKKKLKISKRKNISSDWEVMEDGGNVNTLEGDLYAKILLNRNRDLEFVDRAYAQGKYPQQFGTERTDFDYEATHKMGWGEDEDGQAYIYPTIFNPNKDRIAVPNQYADYISSEGYKNETGLGKKYGGSIPMMPDGGYTWSTNTAQTPKQQVVNTENVNTTKFAVSKDKFIQKQAEDVKKSLSGLNKKYGNPEVSAYRSPLSLGKEAAMYNPFTNTIHLNLDNKLKKYLNFFEDEGFSKIPENLNLTTYNRYLAELPHAAQRKNLGAFGFAKKYITEDIPVWMRNTYNNITRELKGDERSSMELSDEEYDKFYATPYEVKGTIENEAHDIIEPKIREEFAKGEFKNGGKIPKAGDGKNMGYSWSTQQVPTQQVVGSVENTQTSKPSIQPFQKGYVNPNIMTSKTGEEGLGDDLGGMMVTAALAPGSLPFRASGLGRVGLEALELANPISGFRGIKPKFALQNADPILTNQTKGFNVEYDGLLDFQKKAGFEPYKFDNKNWYDVPEQSQIDFDKIDKLKNIKPSEYFDRRQFAKKLIEKGIVSKKTDIQKYARSLEDTEDLTKRAIEQANTYYRGVTTEIPKDANQNVISAMKDAGVDFSNKESIGKYMAEHIPLQKFGYRSGVGDARGLDALYTAKGSSSYGDMTFELKKPFDFSEGSYKDWLNKYETPTPIYDDIQKTRELEWKKNFPEKRGSYYMSDENFNAQYPKWMTPYKGGDAIFMGTKGERIFDNAKKVEGEIGRTKRKDLPYKNGGKVKLKLKPKSSDWEIVG